MRRRCPNQVQQQYFFNLIAFIKINCAASFCIQAGVKQAIRIRQGSAFEKIYFEMMLESSESTDVSIFCEDRSVPFPILDDAWVGTMYQLAQIGKRFTAPISQI